MTRYMTLKTSKDAVKALWWFEGSYGVFYITAYLVALCTRALIPEADFDTELALPKLAMEMLPEILVGVILAGIFASTISTADSLVLSSTASLTQEIFHKYRNSYLFMKVGTLGVTAFALAIALSGQKSVFDLTMFAIALMSAGFAPLFVICVMRWPIKRFLAFTMIAGGIAAAVSWRYAGYHAYVFDSLIGMVTAFAIYGAGLLMIKALPRSG